MRDDHAPRGLFAFGDVGVDFPTLDEETMPRANGRPASRFHHEGLAHCPNVSGNLGTGMHILFARESELPRRLRQPEIVRVAPLSQKLAQPRNTEEFP